MIYQIAGPVASYRENCAESRRQAVAAPGVPLYHARLNLAAEFKLRPTIRKVALLMLESLRSGASSWVAKGLLGLLVISFGIWGIGGDYLRGIGSSVPIEVGDIQVGPNEFALAYRQELESLRQRLGAPIDSAMARRLGLVDLTAERIVQNAVFTQAARNLGLDVSDEMLRQRIATTPAFQNSVTGAFDPVIYRQRLRATGFSEQAFVAQMRDGILRDYLIRSVGMNAAKAPTSIVDTLYRYRMEARVAEYFNLPASAVAEPATPDESVLEKFHADHAAEFTAPEYRSVTFLTLSPEVLADTVAVSEEEIVQEYQDRADEFRVPERRTVQQLVFTTKEAAEKARQRIVAGTGMATVAKEDLGLGKADIELGEVTRTDLPDDVAGPVFSLLQDQLSEPVKSPLGWHLFRVTKIKPEGGKTLAEVRDALKRDIALRKAADEVYKLSATLEDELAGGATLEEAGAKLNLPVGKITAVDANGKDPEGKPVTILPKGPVFLTTVFETDIGEPSNLIEGDGGSYFIARVNNVTPSALRPLAAVRDKVIALWKKDQRQAAVEARAAELAKEISGGTPIADIAKRFGQDVETSRPFDRSGSGAPDAFTPSVIGDLFNASVGQVVTGLKQDRSGAVVARLNLVKIPEIAREAPAYKSQSEQIASAVQRDILDRYLAALRKQTTIKVDRQALDSLVQ